MTFFDLKVGDQFYYASIRYIKMKRFSERPYYANYNCVDIKTGLSNYVNPIEEVVKINIGY
jgi:hypothetical protein